MKFKKTTLATIIASLSTSFSVAYASSDALPDKYISEAPVVGKIYDEFLFYDNDGSKDISIQGSVTGQVNQYFFNKGALLDASNGGLHSTILVHNWGTYPQNNPDCYKTKSEFNIGSGYDFYIKRYDTTGAFEVQEGATLVINNGNIVLESGVANNFDLDSNESIIHMQDGGKLLINSESLWMGNKREDMDNAGGINIYGDSERDNVTSKLDISLSKSFVEDNVVFGIAAQALTTNDKSEVSVKADEGISINAFYSDAHKASHFLGAGFYLLAYHEKTAKTNLNLESTNGNINVTAQGYGYYGYGNVTSTISSGTGDVSIIGRDKQAIYLGGNSGITRNNSLSITAGKNIVLHSDSDYSVQIDGDETQNGINLTLSAHDNINITGNGYGIYAYNGDVSLTSNKLIIDSFKDWYSLCVFTGSTVIAQIGDLSTFDDEVYVSGGTLNLSSPKSIFNDKIRVKKGGKVNIDSATSFVASIDDDIKQIIMEAHDKSSINGVLGTSLIKGKILSLSDSLIDLSISSNSVYEGSTSISSTDETDGNINLKLSDNSTWLLTDNSSLSHLMMNNSLLDFSSHQISGRDKQYRIVTTKQFDGKKNTLRMQIDLANETKDMVLTDQLNITGQALGTHTADLKIDGKDLVPNKLHSENWLISQGADSDMSILNKEGKNQYSGRGMVTTWGLAFVANGEEDKLNTAEGLAQLVGNTTGIGEGKWYLVRNDEEIVDPNPNPGPDPKPDPKPEQPKPNDPAEIQQITNLGISATQALSFASELEDLRSRLGEVRYGAQDGAWVRAGYAKETADGYNGRGFEQKTHDLHIGLDRIVAADEDSSWLVGGALRYAKSKQEGFTAAQGGEGELEQYSAKLYATYMHAQGSYADFVLQAGRYSQDLTGLANDLSSAFKADYKTYGYGASVEIGHMFDFNNQVDDRQWFNHFFIEPQLQLSYFNAHGKDYKTSTGLAVSQSDADFLTGRAGVVLGKKFNYGTADDLDKRYFQVGLKGGVKYEFLGDQTIRFTGIERITKERKADDVDGARYYYGVTADWQLSHNFRAYATVEREEGDHYTKDFDVSVGVKYQF